MIVVVSGEWTVGDDLVRRLAAHGIEISTCERDQLAAHLAGARAGAVVVDGRGGFQQLINVVGRLGVPTLPPEALVGLDQGTVGNASQRAAPPGGRPVERADVEVGAIVLSASALRVTVNGRSEQLRPKEVDLLSFFLTHPGEVFSRSELMESVWGYDIGDPSTVAVQIRRIREKIEEDPANPTILVTVWGAGYRLDVPESDISSLAPKEPALAPKEPALAPKEPALAPVADPVVPPLDIEEPHSVPEQPAVVSPVIRPRERSRPPGRSTPLVPELRAVDARGPRWDGAVELARTRVYDAMARLQRRRSSARVDPRVWAMIESFASLRLDGFDVAFDPVKALVPGDEHSDTVMAHYIDALAAAAQPFAEGRDVHSVLDLSAPQPLEPLVTLDLLCQGDPTMFGRATTLDEFVEAVARFEVAPAVAGAIPRTIRVALATWAQRVGRLDTPIAMSLGLVMALEAPANAEQRRHSLLLALGRGSELMDRAEQHVRRLRELYVGETAASSSLKVIDLIDLFTAMPMITVEHSAEVLDVSPQTVHNNVQRFEQMGWLVSVGPVGKNGQEYWYAREVVEAIMLTIAEPMQRLCAIDAMASRHVLDPSLRRSAAV